MDAIITNKGLALLAKLTQGNALEITCAKTGAGTVDASLLPQQTGVTNQKQTMTINSVSYPEDGKCALVLSVTNAGVASGYTIMQIGVYAQDPDEGEVLFSIWQVDSGTGINILSETVLPGYNAEINYHIKYDQAESVNVNVDPSNTVSRATMEAYVNKEVKGVVDAHTANKSNPHNVTAAQVGLGNVDNTADNDKHVAYAQRAGSADKAQYDLTIRINGGRTEGTDQWTYDGSTSRTVNITPAKIGAAEAAHEHDAADVSSGTLDLARLPLDELVNLHIWKKFDSEPTIIETKKTDQWIGKSTGTDGDNNEVYQSVQYSDAITNENGVLSLVNPTTIDAPTENTIQVVKGKYIYSVYADGYFRIPSDATIADNAVTYPSRYYTLKVSTAYALTQSGNKLGYAASKEADTYPENGEHTDGYWYVYHKQLGE